MYRFYSGSAGRAYGLSVLLDPEEDQYVSPITPFVGFFAIAHEGRDNPSVLLKGKIIKKNQAVDVGINFNMIDTEYEAKFFTPEQRGCLFSYEKELDQSLLYSFQNCINDCRNNAMIKHCGCIPFYLENKCKNLKNIFI